MVTYNITVADRKTDSRNGRKAKGSSWGKKRKRTVKRTSTKRRYTPRDRKIFSANGRKAKGSSWKR